MNKVMSKEEKLAYLVKMQEIGKSNAMFSMIDIDPKRPGVITVQDAIWALQGNSYEYLTPMGDRVVCWSTPENSGK